MGDGLSGSAVLVLEDGSIFRGTSVGVEGVGVGEVVFNTSMTGYQEILTDPSYCQQMVTLTYPHIGNTGVNEEDCESSQVHATGLIIRDMPLTDSSWRSESSLGQFLKSRQVVGIADIDTRRLTRLLRKKGALNGCILAGDDDVDRGLQLAKAFSGLSGKDLAQEVSVTEPYRWEDGLWRLGDGHPVPKESPRFSVVAYDFGLKRNILRLLFDRGCSVTVVPAKTPVSEVLALSPDGIFLSNGPGDPEPCSYAITAIKALLEEKLPIFGICLGFQLLALASGAKTLKMKFGHHGANHPVKDLAAGTVFISSQNHGFAVDEATLPDTLRITHRSLFDETLQGLQRTDCPAFGFQGHPEASPGPRELESLFDRFVDLMEAKTVVK